MTLTKEEFAQTKATGWFRTLERQLGEMAHLEDWTRSAGRGITPSYR